MLQGYVYGEEALAEQALINDGQVICPRLASLSCRISLILLFRTKEIYNFKDSEKVYVMWSVYYTSNIFHPHNLTLSVATLDIAYKIFKDAFIPD